MLGATAARNRELTATINALPAFLREVRAASRNAQAAAADAAPALRTLRPVASRLKPGLQEAIKLGPTLQRVAKGLDPVITEAQTGLPALTSIVKAASPLVDVLNSAGRDLVPVVQVLDTYRDDTIAAAANIAAATNYTTPGPEGKPMRALRVLSPLWGEGLVGAEKRSPSNRYNPYHEPGGLRKMATGLESFSCAHTSNPGNQQSLGAMAAPCLTMKPWTFKGEHRSFPNVTQDP